LLKTNLPLKILEKKRKEILDKLYDAVPSGVGREGSIKMSDEDLKEILKEGAQWMIKNGYGEENDCIYTEEEGKLKNANPEDVSQRAKARGRSQLGTLGSGNHFLELQKVEKIFDEEIAKIFGLEQDQIVIMIHCGSRGLGHQTASDYIMKMEKVYGYKHLPDRELINAPIKSELGKKYLSAMACAANFGFANKQLITHRIRDSLKKIYPDFKAEVIYDICHNIAKFEKHKIDEKEKEILIVRKGATRSFGPGRKELPKKYQKTGCPIFIPGSMGTFSYVLVGTKKAEEISLASTPHGAGRAMSRKRAKEEITEEKLKSELEEYGVMVRSGSIKGMIEEAPKAYKDVDEVVRVSHELGIGKLVARLKPLAVMKG
jgi:tRNA-splicing ligase RtcB